MAMAIFMFVLLLGMDLLVSTYQRMTIRYVLTRAARQIILQPHTVTQAQQKIVDVADKFGFGMSASEVTICLNVDTSCANPGQSGQNTGVGRSLITISARKSVGVLVPMEFSSFIVVRNENYA